MPSQNAFLTAISETFVTFIDVIIGDTSISGIGDGTIRGALSSLQTNKAPTNHASVATGYGLGTSSAYGHAKIINNLTTSTYADGQALSANQGYELKRLIDQSGGGGSSIDISTTEPSSPSDKLVWIGGD